MPSRPIPPPSPSFVTKTRVLFLALTISASVVIFCSLLYFLYHLWHSLVHRAKTIPFEASAPLKLQRFSYKELKHATNGFDTANVIGKGGSGTVFRGILKDGKLVAVKRLDTLSLQTEREFQNELQILGGLRSPFLVTLSGYSVEKNKRMLVYEYMPNRSLQESLFGDGCLCLSWERRFCIILDVARGLEFLHLGCDPPVIHGDIKPSNILLDAEYNGRISDFGLSRIKVEEISISDIGGDDWNCKFVPYDDEFSSIDHSKELTVNSSLVDDEKANGKQWGKDWWWKQDGNGELCSKDYVMEWIGSQISPSNPDWDDGKNNIHEKIELENSSPLDKPNDANGLQMQVFEIGNNTNDGVEKKDRKKKQRNMQEWWKEEHLAELSKKSSNLRNLQTKWKKGLKVPHFDLDERLKEDYNKDQASLCINLALTCLQKISELRPDIGDIVKILKGDMDLPPLPFEFSPSPPSKLYSRSRRKPKGNAE
ncbi:Serine/threonine-protein kinase, active site [Sesbania bispinosa]|nr:Serine/threonine-protein kinase, active site [Sesbania bispinosa]